MTMSRTYPLGRRVEHDPRSLAYAHGVLPRSAIHSVNWTRRADIFDQGQLGSCTGNAAAGAVGSDSYLRTGSRQVTITAAGAAASHGYFKAGLQLVNEPFAINAYGLATVLDEFTGSYPPDDTGSSGIGAAKALQTVGLITGYTHAFDILALKSALQAGPVLWGTVWLQSMFSTDTSGFLVVDRSSAVVGGHELCITGYEVDTGVYKVANSWGKGWGKDGFCFVALGDMAWLLAHDGDITVPAWASVPPVISDQVYWNQAKAWAAGKGLV